MILIHSKTKRPIDSIFEYNIPEHYSFLLNRFSFESNYPITRYKILKFTSDFSADFQFCKERIQGKYTKIADLYEILLKFNNTYLLLSLLKPIKLRIRWFPWQMLRDSLIRLTEK